MLKNILKGTYKEEYVLKSNEVLYEKKDQDQQHYAVSA